MQASSVQPSENDRVQEPQTSISFAAEFWRLKQSLECAKHVGKCCYVRPTDGGHEEQDVYKLTSWAKSIVSNYES